MKIRSFFSLVSFLFVAFAVDAQSNASFSTPLDIPQVGWNKVLCMKNGNTMLFHFEVNKPMVIKVFDSTHKEIASKPYLCKQIDESAYKLSMFKGAFQAGDEAVLFISQEKLSKACLFRLRVNSVDGAVIDESMIDQVGNLDRAVDMRVLQKKNENGYEVLCAYDQPQYKRCDVHIDVYSSRHDKLKTIVLPVKRVDYDRMGVLGCDHNDFGYSVSLFLDKELENGTTHLVGAVNAASLFNESLCNYFIAEGKDSVSTNVIDMGTSVRLYYSLFSYNAFANAVNTYNVNYWEMVYLDGLVRRPTATIGTLFLSTYMDPIGTRHNWVKNDTADNWCALQTGNAKRYAGMPLKMYTSTTGLSTVISQSFNRWNNIERGRNSFEVYFGDLCVTQVDDNGKEIWGRILPLQQYYRSFARYYAPVTLSEKQQTLAFLDDEPEEVYNRQFVSANSYTHERNYFVVYNDYDSNFGKDIKSKTDTVYDFAKTNACYYKVDRKKEVTKHYVFGTPAAGEHKATFRYIGQKWLVELAGSLHCIDFGRSLLKLVSINFFVL
jgi:hypothetical protein